MTLIVLLPVSRLLLAQDIRLAVSGAVLDNNSEPIPGAVVRLQATQHVTKTDARGRFVLHLPTNAEGMLSAWAEGYYIAGLHWPSPAKQPVFHLKGLPPGDNSKYRWTSPHPAGPIEIAVSWLGKRIFGEADAGDDPKDRCGNCHAERIYPQWLADAHAQSTRNLIFFAFYNGTSVNEEAARGPGYRADFPASSGDCAACHAPRHALSSPFGTDMNRVEAYDITCDFCHKVKAVILRSEAGYPGVLSIKLNRPPPGQQVFYGPFDDVVVGPDTYSALHKDSRFCAPCHSGRFWGVPIYSEFDEWQTSEYAQRGVTCQNCHMPADGATFRVAPQHAGGVVRDPDGIATHKTLGVTNVPFMREAVAVTTTAAWVEGGRALEAKVVVRNEGVGHHFPSGVPMRHAILVIEAFDATGTRLEQESGPVLPIWCGQGAAAGDFAGLPGKVYVKLLRDIQRGYGPADARPELPAPHWRQVKIEVDTRLPAKRQDEVTVRFASAEDRELPMLLRVRLVYRRAFKAWIEAKKLPTQDLVLVDERVPIYEAR